MELSVFGYVLLAAAIAALISFYQYFNDIRKKEDRSLWIALIIRFLSVFFLLILLFNPQYKKFTSFLKKPVLVVAFDNSSSINFLNQSQRANQFLTQFKNSERLKERFDISYYTFGNTIGVNSELTFKESQTRINDLFNAVDKIYNDKSMATVLISDGNQTFGRDYSFITKKEGHKVFPVVLGDTSNITDLKISRINTNKYAFTGNKFPVEIFLSYEGSNPVKAEIMLYSGENTIFKEALNFEAPRGTIIKNINLEAGKPGIKVYRAQISFLDEEPNKTNNTKEFAIEVIDQRTEVLVVSDMLHPDLGTLKKSIESNEQRIVKFTKSRVSQQVIDQSQLIIIYQPNAAFSDLFKVLEQQKRNYLIITGTRTDWNFLNNIQKNFSKEWVRQTEDIQGDLNSSYSSFNIESLSFEDYPPLEGYLGNLSFSIPFETLLFERIRNVKLENPLLATYENNGNRFAILNGENIWKWRAHNYVKDTNFKDFDLLLGKLVFYLSTNKKRERLTLDYQPFYDGSNELKISASYFNKNYEFDSAATIILQLNPKPSGKKLEIPLVLKGNYYEADISTVPSGAYDFKVTVAGENISKSGQFRILDFDIEKQFLKADLERMQRLASSTSGKLFYAEEFEKLEEQLLQDADYKPVRQSKAEVVSLIDFRMLLFIIIVLLSAEWFLRKYKGYI